MADKVLQQIDEDAREDLATASFAKSVQEATPLDLLERLSEMLADHVRDRRCSTYPDGSPDEAMVHARAIVLHLRNRAAAGKIIDIEKLAGPQDVVQ